MSVEAHRHAAPAALTISVITVSDTRSLETDASGQKIAELVEAAGHRLLPRALVHDDVAEIRGAVREAIERGVHAIIVTGGTGISSRDVTPEALRPLLSRELPGFGELFRMLSYQQVGPAAMLSRSFAGVLERSLIFALPGSRRAVELAVTTLILPEVSHMVWEVRRQPSNADM